MEVLVQMLRGTMLGRTRMEVIMMSSSSSTLGDMMLRRSLGGMERIMMMTIVMESLVAAVDASVLGMRRSMERITMVSVTAVVVVNWQTSSILGGVTAIVVVDISIVMV